MRPCQHEALAGHDKIQELATDERQTASGLSNLG